MAIMGESHKRTIMKTIIWRLVATSVTILVAYAWFGEWSSSVARGIAANLLKTILYYVHERVWNRTDYGRKKSEEDYMI